MNGLGNEIAVLDLRGSGLTVSGPEARAIGHGEGVAFDQLMVLHEPRSVGADAFMTIYNSDGSQAGACGNGARCVAFILTRGTPREKLVLETAQARLECLRGAETVFSVDMGRPRLAWNEIPLRDPAQEGFAEALPVLRVYVAGDFDSDSAALGSEGSSVALLSRGMLQCIRYFCGVGTDLR